MRLRRRWIQIVVLCVLTSGCVPSACIVVGDVEWPRTPKGGYVPGGFFGATESILIPAALYIFGGTLLNASRPGWSATGRLRVELHVFRPVNGAATAVDGLGIVKGNFQRNVVLRRKADSH